MLEALLTHLNESNRSDVLKALFKAKSFEAFLAECTGYITSQPARMVADLSRLRHEGNKRFESLGKLQAHAKRATTKPLREYLASLRKLEENFRGNPSRNLWRVLCRHAEHSQALIEELQGGEFAEQMALVNLESLQEELAKDAEAFMKMIGKASGERENDEVDDEDIHDHDKFVKALQKDFDIEVHHFEPVNEGVFVFLDEENNDLLLAGLKSLKDRLDKLTDKHGYLLIRKGTVDDIVWGSYPNGLAKWMFIKCPQDSENWEDDLADLEDEIFKQSKLDPKEPKDTKDVGRDVRAENFQRNASVYVQVPAQFQALKARMNNAPANDHWFKADGQAHNYVAHVISNEGQTLTLDVAGVRAQGGTMVDVTVTGVPLAWVHAT